MKPKNMKTAENSDFRQCSTDVLSIVAHKLEWEGGAKSLEGAITQTRPPLMHRFFFADLNFRSQTELLTVARNSIERSISIEPKIIIILQYLKTSSTMQSLHRVSNRLSRKVKAFNFFGSRTKNHLTSSMSSAERLGLDRQVRVGGVQISDAILSLPHRRKFA